MKKRAVLSAVASFALAGAMCVGFAACDGKSEAAKFQGEEVKKEVFEAAFDFSSDAYKDFKFVIVQNGKQEMDGKSAERIANCTVIVKDGNQHITQETKVTAKGLETKDDLDDVKSYLTEEEYNQKLADVNAGKKVEIEVTKTEDYYIDAEGYAYTKDDAGVWKKSTSTSVMDSADRIFMSAVGIYSAVSFEDYHYLADLKAYCEDEDGTDCLFKFKDGKLMAACNDSKLSSEVNGMKGGYSTFLSIMATYGGQSVTLPTVAE